MSWIGDHHGSQALFAYSTGFLLYCLCSRRDIWVHFYCFGTLVIEDLKCIICSTLLLHFFHFNLIFCLTTRFSSPSWRSGKYTYQYLPEAMFPLPGIWTKCFFLFFFNCLKWHKPFKGRECFCCFSRLFLPYADPTFVVHILVVARSVSILKVLFFFFLKVAGGNPRSLLFCMRRACLL